MNKHLIKGDKTNVLLLSTGLLLPFGTVGCQEQTKKDQNNDPNVIVILADDMGYGDINANNPEFKIPTPNLDKLVQEGVNFNDAHSNSAVSTPTRYGLLTGRYCFRSRLKSGVLSGYEDPLIEDSVSTIAQLVKQKNYQTACIGKWHLGLGWTKKETSLPLTEGGNQLDPQNTENVDYSASIKGTPVDYGFDYSYIIPASLDITPYVFIENDKATNLPMQKIKGINTERGLFYRAGDAATGFIHENVLQTFIDKAKAFITNADQKRPFLLYLPLNAPHTPWLPTEKYRGMSKVGIYGDYICMVDDMVGQIETVLNNLNIDDNTIVIFTSDNGSHWTLDDIEKFQHRANANRRGMKSDAYDGGHRIPFIVKWGNRLKGGESTDQLTCMTDIYATLADILDVKKGPRQGLDGESFLPYLLNPEKEKTEHAIIHHSISGQFAIRKGDWKLIDCYGSGGWSPASSSNQIDKSKIQLYNMKKDILENTNVAAEYPEIVKELKSELEIIKNK
ncbi:MAG: arylsulfatase [Bacteroidaceae bacterium]